jgi:hypothetical protein
MTVIKRVAAAFPGVTAKLGDLPSQPKRRPRLIKEGRMRPSNFVIRVIGLFFLGLIANSAASAQISNERLTAIRARMEHSKTFFQKIPADAQRKMLSGAALNYIQVVNKSGNLDKMMSDQAAGKAEKPQEALLTASESEIGDLVPVSNPGTNFVFSVRGGFTQSETSTAWCGNNVAVGFNDSGSFIESALSGPGGLSFSGVAHSTDRGSTFHDNGFVNPGPNPANFLLGDPVLNCVNGSTFYYVQIFITADSAGNPLAAVALSTSTDGGATFADPVAVVAKDAFTHFLDKNWFAIDPSDPKKLFVTYTDFDASGTICGFDPFGMPIQRVAIELVRSTNGGASFGAPVLIAELCSPAPNFPFLQGSQVAVGPGSEVYVAWESFLGNLNLARAIHIRKSVNHGASFNSSVKIDNVTCVGDCFALEGGFRAFLDLQGLAVDKSGTRTNGNVYVTWHDGRNFQVPDGESPNGVYAYADALISRSSNGGASWSSAVRVNNNPISLSNRRSTDQYMPGVAVDNTGKVGVCFYDRRRDRLNFLFDRFCAASTDAGRTWANTRQTTNGSAPIHATDGFLNPFYLGDYDGLASDFEKASSGFIGAFQIINSTGVFVPSPDVVATKF